jgi:hypothetical protein
MILEKGKAPQVQVQEGFYLILSYLVSSSIFSNVRLSAKSHLPLVCRYGQKNGKTEKGVTKMK